MTEQYDIVVAGAGHNGLIAGAYLSKAGLSVCVVEKQPYVGGGAVTRELTIPGFKHDECSTGHMLLQANPLIINDELGLLSKYGLKYIKKELYATILFPDDTYMCFYKDVDKTCEVISKFSQKDAERYREFTEWMIKSLDFLTMGMFAPATPFGSLVAMLDQSDEGREILRALSVSIMDICDEWFESDEMKIALSRLASEFMISPQTKGTGVVLFMFIAFSHKYGSAIPEGGSGQLSKALRRYIEDHGNVVKTSSLIEKFRVTAGECTGVVLESGEEILAKKAVVSNFNIKQIPDMVGRENLPSGYVKNVDRTAFSDYQGFHMELALNEAPKFKAPLNNLETTFLEFASKDMLEHLRLFDDLKYGISNSKIPLLIIPTLVDKTRSPEGKHILYIYHYAPYNLRDGGPEMWKEIKDQYVEDLLETIRARTTNMGSENILGTWAMSPYDYSLYNPSLIHGDICQIGGQVVQIFGNRPVPGYNYRTPIKGLYMCGPSTHPGFGVVGASRAAMPIIMEDLKLDFEKVIS